MFTIREVKSAFPSMSDDDARTIYGLCALARTSGEIDETLDRINAIVGEHGVEVLRHESHWDAYYGDCIAMYVNVGETYWTTILYDTQDKDFSVTSYGDWYEQWERENLPL